MLTESAAMDQSKDRRSSSAHSALEVISAVAASGGDASVSMCVVRYDQPGSHMRRAVVTAQMANSDTHQIPRHPNGIGQQVYSRTGLMLPVDRDLRDPKAAQTGH